MCNAFHVSICFLNQIENEYGAFGYDDQPRDKAYLRHVKATLESNGIEALPFTSDSPKNTKDWGSLDGGEVLVSTKFVFDFKIKLFIQNKSFFYYC